MVRTDLYPVPQMKFSLCLIVGSLDCPRVQVIFYLSGGCPNYPQAI